MSAEAAVRKLSRVQGAALVVGVLGLAATVAGYFVVRDHPNQFFGAYLVGWMMWTGMSFGCLGVLMLHHLSGGNWGFVSRRFWEAGAMLIPVMALLFVPIALNLASGHGIYEWAHPDVIATNKFVQAKAPYLNVGFFLLRMLVCFAVFTGLAVVLNKYSADIDRTADARIVSKFKVVSGPGILVFFLLMTTFGVDTIMSLEPEWFSSIFALLLTIAMALGAFSLVALFLHLLKDDEPFRAVMIPKRFHEHGTLMLALTLLFAYMAFSQYLISWSGNLPEEAKWYLHRIEGGWAAFAWAIVILHFVVPYLLLLQRPMKRKSVALAVVAVLLIIMRWVDYYWLITPSPVFGSGESLPVAQTLNPAWMAIAATAGLGGLWVFLFVMRLKSRPLVPLYMSHLEHPQPFEAEVLNHG